MELIPGLLQGMTRVLISYPFDYVRTNLQTQQNTNLWSYLKQSKLSIRDAYRGCGLIIVSVPIDRSIQFFLFEHFSKNNSVIKSSIASSLISSIYAVPINFFSTRIITKHIPVTKEYVRNFISGKDYYKGYGADFTKSFLGAVSYTSIYGLLRKNVKKEDHNYFMFGVLSSICSWSLIYPLDTVRVIKQTTNMTYLTIFKNIHITKLYIGFPIVLIRSIPSAGCGMFVYEKSRQLLL